MIRRYSNVGDGNGGKGTVVPMKQTRAPLSPGMNNGRRSTKTATNSTTRDDGVTTQRGVQQMVNTDKRRFVRETLCRVKRFYSASIMPGNRASRSRFFVFVRDRNDERIPNLFEGRIYRGSGKNWSFRNGGNDEQNFKAKFAFVECLIERRITCKYVRERFDNSTAETTCVSVNS